MGLSFAFLPSLQAMAQGYGIACILGGIVVGYILAAAFGMVDFSCIGEAAVFQAPKLLHFGLEFDPAAMVTMGFLYLISSIQMIGDFTATTYGAENRMPTNEELRGGLISAGVVNIAGALFGGLPASTYA